MTDTPEAESVFEEAPDGVEFILRPVQVTLTTSQTGLLAELCFQAGQHPDAPPNVADMLNNLAVFFGEVTLEPLRYSPKTLSPGIKKKTKGGRA